MRHKRSDDRERGDGDERALLPGLGHEDTTPMDGTVLQLGQRRSRDLERAFGGFGLLEETATAAATGEETRADTAGLVGVADLKKGWIKGIGSGGSRDCQRGEQG